MTRYAKRVDSNHGEIREEFRRLMGKDNVIDTSRFGSPFGDLMLTIGHLMRSVETKAPKGTLTEAQERETLPYVLVRTVEECAGVVERFEQDVQDIVEGRKRRLETKNN